MNEIQTDGGNLLCPLCENEYLHHESVVVYSRVEDAERGLRVEVRSGDDADHLPVAPGVTVGTGLTGNPSGRRGGVVVTFWCEGCGGRSSLTFAQHKGQTEVAFGPTGGN